jgi:hypothetical protein
MLILSGTILSLKVECDARGGDKYSRGIDDAMSRYRRHRKGMPCKQARRDVSGEVTPKAASIFSSRSVSVDVDNKNLDMDLKET